MSTLDAVVELHVSRLITHSRLKEQAREEREAADRPTVAPPSITISYAYGSRGSMVAEMLSARLGYQIFDREIIEAISRSTRVQAEIIELLDERKRSLVTSMAEQFLSRRVLDDRSYVHALTRVIRSISLIEPVIFIGRGACHILRGTEAFHVRITASFESRVRRAAKKHDISADLAAGRVQDEDDARRRFIRGHFNRDIDDPVAYDLVINTDRIPPLVAAELIRSVYSGRLGAEEKHPLPAPS